MQIRGASFLSGRGLMGAQRKRRAMDTAGGDASGGGLAGRGLAAVRAVVVVRRGVGTLNFEF